MRPLAGEQRPGGKRPLRIIKRVLLCILAAVLLSGTAFCVWQRENIGALYVALTGDPEEIAANMDDLRREHQTALLEEKKVYVEQPTREQSESLLDGTATAEEVKQALGLTELIEEPESPPEGEEEPADPPPDQSELLSRCVAELYAYKVDLMEELGRMRSETITFWESLEPKERTPAKKQSVIMDGLYACYELEAEADANVRQILEKYRALFEGSALDTQVLDELWVYYCEEKAAEKAYYMNKYLE